MDINQITIKNNQIKKLDNENAKLQTTKDTGSTSFKQILANCKTESSNSTEIPSTNQVQEKNMNQEDLMDLKEEDWQGLESILSILLSAVQQVQTSPILDQKNPPENKDEAQLQIISNLLQQIDGKLVQEPEAIKEKVSNLLAEFYPTIMQDQTTFTDNFSNVLSKFLENQPLTREKSQLLMQTQESQAAEKIPTEMIAKLQALLSGEVKQKNSTEPPSRLSLDKDQILQSTRAMVENTSFHNKLRNASSKEEDLINVPDSSVVVSQQSGTGTNSKNLVHITPPSSTIPVSKFVPEISKWVDRFMSVTNGQSGKSETILSLFPEHLGEIEIKISSQQGQVSAQILTDTMGAKEALEGQLHNLRQALQQHGLQVQNLDVVQQIPSTNFNQLSFSQNGSGYSQGQREFYRNGESSKKQTEKELKEVEGETLAITYGRSAPKLASNIDFTA